MWLDSLYEHQLVYGCLRWPAPAVADPPAPPGAAYPAVPVLVLNGDLDVITPMSDAARAAALFPNATLVPVGNAVHVTALADFDDCAARIVRDFLRSHVVGDTSCASELAELHVVPAFPRTTAAAPAATPAPGDASNAGDRRAGWAAAHTVADALSRWWLMYGVRGHGLRGGTFRTGGSYYGTDPVTFRLRDAQFVGDLAVRGRAAWDREALRMTARVRVSGARAGPAPDRLGDGRAHGDGHRAREARRPQGAADAARALARVRRVVPEPDHAPLPLEPEDAERGGAERQHGGGLGRQPDPARADDPQDVAVAEHRDVAVRGERALDHAVGAGARVRERPRRRVSRRSTGSSRAAPRGSPASCGPRTRRSRTRPGPR